VCEGTAVEGHPNVARAYAGFDAFVRGDIEFLVGLMDEHAVWRVRGNSSVAGEHRGRDAIFGFLGLTAHLTGGTYRAEPQWIVGDDDHIVAVYRASGRRDDRVLDILQAVFVRIEDGRWMEIDAVPFEQYAFDEFWS
jgi:hypothetical protein